MLVLGDEGHEVLPMATGVVEPAALTMAITAA
jgi:hypothetical protein